MGIETWKVIWLTIFNKSSLSCLVNSIIAKPISVAREGLAAPDPQTSISSNLIHSILAIKENCQPSLVSRQANCWAETGKGGSRVKEREREDRGAGLGKEGLGVRSAQCKERKKCDLSIRVTSDLNKGIRGLRWWMDRKPDKSLFLGLIFRTAIENVRL